MRSSTSGWLRWGASTSEGLVRNENEDAFAAESMVFVVADGMGGHQAGEVASALAVQTLRDRLGAGAPSIDVAIAAVIEANAAIFHSAHLDASRRGMGTTLTAIAVMPADSQHVDQLALVNVGDSRTYRVRGGTLERVTVDHSYVQELVATGHITEMEARTHPRRNIVTRALGIEPTVRVDSWVLPVVKGDRFVLCSDGLVDEVPDHEIALVAAGVSDPQSAADELVAMANRHGGRDNVTVIVVDVLDGIDPDDAEVLAGTRATVTDSGDLTGYGAFDADPAGDDDGDGDGMARPYDATGATGRVVAGPVPGDVPDEDDAQVMTRLTPTAMSAAARAGAGASAPTAVLPAAGTARRRLTLGSFLFFASLAAIIVLTVTFVAVAVNKGDHPSTTTTSTTSSTTSTTVAATTTTAATTSTVATSTTATGTVAPTTVATPGSTVVAAPTTGDG